MRGFPLSHTWKNPKPTSRVLELVKRDDGTFDLFLNRRLDQTHIVEEWFPEQLCVRFGFCGEEYDSIMATVNRDGRATVVLSG